MNLSNIMPLSNLSIWGLMERTLRLPYMNIGKKYKQFCKNYI